MNASSSFKCHMCRRKYNWKNKPKEDQDILEETLSILREDDENQFLSLVGSGMSKAFEVIVKVNTPLMPNACSIPPIFPQKTSPKITPKYFFYFHRFFQKSFALAVFGKFSAFFIEQSCILGVRRPFMGVCPHAFPCNLV